MPVGCFGMSTTKTRESEANKTNKKTLNTSQGVVRSPRLSRLQKKQAVCTHPKPCCPVREILPGCTSDLVARVLSTSPDSSSPVQGYVTRILSLLCQRVSHAFSPAAYPRERQHGNWEKAASLFLFLLPTHFSRLSFLTPAPLALLICLSSPPGKTSSTLSYRLWSSFPTTTCIPYLNATRNMGV